MTVSESQSLKIAIAADMLRSHAVGGVEMFIIGLLSGLAKLPNQQEEYFVITNEQDPDWIEPYLAPNQSIVVRHIAKQSKVSSKRTIFQRITSRIGRELKPFIAPLLEPYVDELRNSLDQQSHSHGWPEIQVSDGFYENLGCDVLHFAFQNYTVCAMPTIYTPHDIQHLHFPQNFRACDIAYREIVQPTGCHFAQAVTTGSDWIKQDIVRHYRTDPEKIHVIPAAPASQVFPSPSDLERAEARSKYRLPTNYALYPAVTWPHKNHAGLLHAIAWLKATRQLTVPLVCSGQTTDYFNHLNALVKSLDLEEQVLFLGRVPAEDMRAIYCNARLVVVPTLHEAASFPIFEAWQDRVPVVCSNVTSLPEQVRDAAVIFDVKSIEEMGDAIANVYSDESLRARLIDRGTNRLQCFSWERTAAAYRAVYRKVAGLRLSSSEQTLLSTNWMRDAEMECLV